MLALRVLDNRHKSGRGQPHSKTLARRLTCCSLREVLECGCPLPLFMNRKIATDIKSPVFGFWPRERRTRFGYPGVLRDREWAAASALLFELREGEATEKKAACRGWPGRAIRTPSA